MQIPVLSGIYTDGGLDIRVALPRNLVPVSLDSGISTGYLRPADGIVQMAEGPGIDRGGINWLGKCYRVMGTSFVSVLDTGDVTVIGDVGGDRNSCVTMDYSFDRLAIASGGNLYLYDGTTLSVVSDPDAGTVLDVVWIDGYFLITDGEFVAQTELTDPSAINPLKYGSAEADPDSIVALLRLRNEVYALNRYTIEVLENQGGSGFAFSRIESAQIQRGAVGTHACCVYFDAIAFVGSGRNEPVGVYLGANGSSEKISSLEVDLVLSQYSEASLGELKIEARNDRGQWHLYVHLDDRTLVYDRAMSEQAGGPVWFALSSGVGGAQSKYRARNMVWCYDLWIVGDPSGPNIGALDHRVGSHWGQVVGWEFGTRVIYAEGKGAVVGEIEMVSLPGRQALGEASSVSTSYSVDGVTWSQDRTVSSGLQGDRARRFVWRRQGKMRHWRVQRFRGDSRNRIPVIRIEAAMEALAY